MARQKWDDMTEEQRSMFNTRADARRNEIKLERSAGLYTAQQAVRAPAALPAPQPQLALGDQAPGVGTDANSAPVPLCLATVYQTPEPARQDPKDGVVVLSTMARTGAESERAGGQAPLVRSRGGSDLATQAACPDRMGSVLSRCYGGSLEEAHQDFIVKVDDAVGVDAGFPKHVQYPRQCGAKCAKKALMRPTYSEWSLYKEFLNTTVHDVKNVLGAGHAVQRGL